MITDYCSEIKIAIFQSVSERQRAKWATIVKLRPSRSKNSTNCLLKLRSYT